MNEGIRRTIPLLLVFAIAFTAVYSIRNGKKWFGEKEPDYRSEDFTLPSKPPLKLDDVELLSRLNDEYAALTDAVVRSVVSIDTSGVQAQRLQDRWGRQFVRPVPTQGQGSGVIVTHQGHVVTNHHVVNGQQQIQVKLHDGRMFPATLIGSDPMLDIAVIKIEGENGFHPLKFGDSDKVRRGQIVFAFGNPFGLGETVTQGIISALERSLSDTQRDLFQTDAAINPGNSGGPLVNLQGEIIGINSAIYRPDQRINSGFQGVGFSIRSNDVKEVMYSILERGRPIRGYLGVRMLDLDMRIKQAFGYDGNGAMVIAVGEGSPAQKAGLKAEDIIRSYDGEEVESIEQLFHLVQTSHVGESVEIEYWRAGEISTTSALIEESSTQSIGDTPPSEETLRAIGIVTMDPLEGTQGVLVKEIMSGSIAAGRLIVGDQILAVNRVPVNSTEEFEKTIAAYAKIQPTELQVIRGRTMIRVILPMLTAK